MKVNGWTLHAHECFIEQLTKLADIVERQQKKDPVGYASKTQALVLASIYALIMDKIPADPSSSAFDQGMYLGKEHRHWKRAKFNERYRLFFLYLSPAKELIYAWVNDENTLRKIGSKNDPYVVFAKMLGSGKVPNSWAGLLAAAAAVDPESDELIGQNEARAA